MSLKTLANQLILFLYDALGNNQTVTHVSRCMKVGCDYIPLNDGEDIIFANTFVDDGSDKAELLQLMLLKEAFYNEKFPAISNAMKYFKDTEGGRSEMCKSVEILGEYYAKERRTKDIQKMLLSGKTAAQIADFCGYDLSEVEEAEKALLATAE